MKKALGFLLVLAAGACVISCVMSQGGGCGCLSGDDTDDASACGCLKPDERARGTEGRSRHD